MPSSISGQSLAAKTDAPNPAVVVLNPAPPKRNKKVAPQDAIDDFWLKFYSTTPGKATNILPKNVYARQVRQHNQKSVARAENAVASYETAAALCTAKVAKIVQECRRINAKYRDPHFDIEFDLKWGVRDCLRPLSASSKDGAEAGFEPGSVKRVGDIFEKPRFFVDGANANDVRQGRDGDCWFLAALCTLSNKPSLIEKICVARNEDVGVYGFVFHRDGEWRSEIIDDKLYLTKPDYDESWIDRMLFEDLKRINSEAEYKKTYQTGSSALYFAQCQDQNETWLPLMEKAYAKAHGDYAAIEGGYTGEGIEDMTGGVTTELFSTDILDKEYFWKEELLKVNQQFLFGCSACAFSGRGYRKGIYESHAYSIMRAVEMDGQRLLLLRNPWGEGEWTGPWSDGSKEWTPEWMTKLGHTFGDDGQFWMSYEDLLQKYSSFDRTRLFEDDWKITQGWTSLEVGWTVDYHATKFEVTIDKDGPIVVVLSQLDERYFVGLTGQYDFELAFRIHKAGEDDYIIRSQCNYMMRRSVTAELDLPAGTYHVLMKVKGSKRSNATPIDQVIRNNVKDRRDKLIRVGMAYDLAHAKGIDAEQQKKERKAAAKRVEARLRKEIRKNLLKEKKRRKRAENREKRKERKLKAKQKAKKAARRQKKKEKEEAEQAKTKAQSTSSKPESVAVNAKPADTTIEVGKEDAATAKKGQADINDLAEKVSGVSITASAGEDKKIAGVEAAMTVDGAAKEEGKASDVMEAAKSEAAHASVENAGSQNPEKPVDASTTTGPAPKEKDVEKPVDAPAGPSPPTESSKPALDGAKADESDSSSDDSDSTLSSDVSSIPESLLDEEVELRRPAVADDDRDSLGDPAGLLSGIGDMVPPALPGIPIFGGNDVNDGGDGDEDEFQKDPWNAICVVGLRVYSRNAAVVVVRVVKPENREGKGGKGGTGTDGEDEEEEEGDEEKKKEKKDKKKKMMDKKEKDEKKEEEKDTADADASDLQEQQQSHGLDVDDSAADALKDTPLETKMDI